MATITPEIQTEICTYAVNNGNGDINEIISLMQEKLQQDLGIQPVDDGWYIYEGFGTAYYLKVLHLSMRQYFIVWGSRLPIGAGYSGRYESEIRGVVLKGRCHMSYETDPTALVTCGPLESYTLSVMQSDTYAAEPDTWVCEFANGSILSTPYMFLIYLVPFALETFDFTTICKLVKYGFLRIFGGIEKPKRAIRR